MEQPIIDPVSADAIEAELTPSRFLRDTCKGDNKIYVIDACEAPNVMREIGRLREQAFRAAGGGTGQSCDIDEFDTMPHPCHQMIVWDPRNRQILGGYRFIPGNEIEILPDNSPHIATSHMFRFSKKFIDNYLPQTLELGRSFVRIDKQSTRDGINALFTLDNLWDGLGALTIVYPHIKYLFGKVTMYPTYNQECRNMILYFLFKHFHDKENLVTPIESIVTDTDIEAMNRMFVHDNIREDYKVLHSQIRSLGYNIPPLVNAYIGLSPTMKVFGTAVNHEFGEVEETSIFISIDDIYEAKKDRHIESFLPETSGLCDSSLY